MSTKKVALQDYVLSNQAERRPRAEGEGPHLQKRITQQEKTSQKKGKIENPSTCGRDLWQEPATVGIVQREAEVEEPPIEASSGRKIPRKKPKKLGV